MKYGEDQWQCDPSSDCTSKSHRTYLPFFYGSFNQTSGNIKTNFLWGSEGWLLLSFEISIYILSDGYYILVGLFFYSRYVWTGFPVFSSIKGFLQRLKEDLVLIV